MNLPESFMREYGEKMASFFGIPLSELATEELHAVIAYAFTQISKAQSAETEAKIQWVRAAADAARLRL